MRSGLLDCFSNEKTIQTYYCFVESTIVLSIGTTAESGTTTWSFVTGATVVSVVVSVSVPEPLLQATMNAAIATTANTFFIVLNFNVLIYLLYTFNRKR